MKTLSANWPAAALRCQGPRLAALVLVPYLALFRAAKRRRDVVKQGVNQELCFQPNYPHKRIRLLLNYQIIIFLPFIFFKILFKLIV